MARDFGNKEREICSKFKENAEFTLNGESYRVVFSGKPTCAFGEPKTDIFVKAKNILNDEGIELKISYKKNNADFLENKTNAERAEHLFGSRWYDIVCQSTTSIKNQFEERPLIYKTRFRKTDVGAITLGWKFELLRVPSGILSGIIDLSHEQVIDVYSGTSLSSEKKNAVVNGQVINNSGVAEYILFGDNFNDIQSIVDNLEYIEDYVQKYPKIYFACKALNYRSYEDKFDGDRPLAVYVDWSVEDGKLTSKLVFDKPLDTKGNIVADKLKLALAYLNMHSTDDMNSDNVSSSIKIFG